MGTKMCGMRLTLSVSPPHTNITKPEEPHILLMSATELIIQMERFMIAQNSSEIQLHGLDSMKMVMATSSFGGIQRATIWSLTQITRTTLLCTDATNGGHLSHKMPGS